MKTTPIAPTLSTIFRELAFGSCDPKARTYVLNQGASDAEWKALQEELRRESTRWAETLVKSREVSEDELGCITGSVAHAACHFGAIRQIHRATRGPTAEDEVRARVS